MAVELDKIAIAVDFSTESLAALEHAVDLAERTGATLELLHAGFSPEIPERIPGALHSTYSRYETELRDSLAEDENRLVALRKKLEARGRIVSHILVQGRADSALAEAAEQVGAQLLVAGTHGRSGVSRFLLGSVAERVVRLASMSVLIARGAPPEDGYARIVVPTDFSDQAERALELALDLAPAGARIDIVHACSVPAPYMSGWTPAGERAFEETYAVEARAHGMDLLKTIERDDVKARFHLRRDSAADAIVGWLTDNPADLVVMGSHGRRGISRLLLGSVAELTVRHADCSVLIAR